MSKRTLQNDREFQFMHITVKATGKGHASDQWIFSNDQKVALMNELSRFLKLFSPIKLLAVTTLSNHIHFMIRIPKEYKISRKEVAEQYFRCYGKKILANGSKNRKLLSQLNNISCFMQRFLWHFSVTFNKTRKFKRTGHLWESRFHNTNIGDAESLLKCWVYVIFNPTKANMISNPLEYEFNSLNFGSEEQQKRILQDLFESYKYLSGKDYMTLDEFKELLMSLINQELSEWKTKNELEREQYRVAHHFWDRVSYVDKYFFPD